MNHLKLPSGLKSRIVDYYSQMWLNYRTLDGNVSMFIPEYGDQNVRIVIQEVHITKICLIGRLNKSLGSEVLLFMRTSIISKVPFFVQCPHQIIHQLVMSLLTEVLLKGDYVFHTGVPGKEMFLISRGKCEETNNSLRNESSIADDSQDNHEKDDDNDADEMTYARSNRETNPNAQRPRAMSSLLPTFSTAPFYQRHLSEIFRSTKKEDACFPPNHSPRRTVNESHEMNADLGGEEILTSSADQQKPPIFGSNPKEERLIATEKVIRVLPRGSYFGEVALVSNARRGCNVRASSFCEIQVR
jgi:CRP-like cAMP-binding protein